ncbi:MAG: hypothetical protein V1664_05175 [Candidatus Uhrbacteria bacterium]
MGEQRFESEEKPTAFDTRRFRPFVDKIEPGIVFIHASKIQELSDELKKQLAILKKFNSDIEIDQGSISVVVGSESCLQISVGTFSKSPEGEKEPSAGIILKVPYGFFELDGIRPKNLVQIFV